jgi:hypothetical protein
MNTLGPARIGAILGTAVGAVTTAGGPTREQLCLLDAVARHVFAVDLSEVEPLDPQRAAEMLTDPDDRRMVVEGLVVLELACHPPSEALVERVQQYLTALGSDESQVLARDYVRDERAQMEVDYRRIYQKPPLEDSLVGAGDDDLAGRLTALATCRPGTVGRSFHDFYRRHDYAWPVQDPSMVWHDLSHVLAGYRPLPEAEIALQAMMTAATGGQLHYPGLLVSLLLYEVGMVPFNGLEPKESVLGRPGAADLFGSAIARGLRCGADFGALDLFEMADQDLAQVRGELGIDAPPTGPFTFAA